MLRARWTAYSQGVCCLPLMLWGCRSCSVVMMKELLSSVGLRGGSLSAEAWGTFLAAAGNGLHAGKQMQRPQDSRGRMLAGQD